MKRLIFLTAATLAVSFVASAVDLTGTPTLSANQTLNLETGATASTGGDMAWSGTVLSFPGTATAYNSGGGGAAAYSFFSEALITQAYSSLLSKASYPAASLSVGMIIIVKTNSAHYAKALITSLSGTSIGFQFTTYGATGGSGGGPSGPTISGVQNNYSYIQPGFPNYGISPGTLFIVKGTGLAAPNSPAVLQDSSKGLPKLLNGSSVSVTVNGTTVTPAFYYALDVQLALVLPANTPTGTGTLTVTYNGTASSPASIVVSAVAPGLDAYYGTGAGLAVATNPLTGVLYNYTNSVKPGDTIVLWGTGFGGITADSDTTFGTPHSVPTLPTIYFGSIGVTPGYAGGSGYPGLNQLNVTVPLNATTGCNISVIAVTNGVPSNSLSLPIAAGGGVCSDPTFGITGSQLQNLSNSANVSTGFLGIFRSISGGTTTDSAIASFQKTTGSSYSSGGGQISLGSCAVTQTLGSATTGTTTGLVAGTITLTGPSGAATLQGNSFVPGSYFATLNAGFIPSGGGTFTFNATAGTDVGSFSATLNYPTPLSWTNSAANATATRTSGQTVNWTGGTAGSYVGITGSSAATVAGQTVTGSYTCYAPATAGTFTVPPAVLLSLPAGTGSTGLFNYTNFTTFTAKGIDNGFVYGGSSQAVTTTFN